MLGSPIGGLTCHGVSPVMSKPSEGKVLNFENLDWLGTRENVRCKPPGEGNAGGKATGSKHSGKRPGC
jgi:hypothetical protein